MLRNVISKALIAGILFVILLFSCQGGKTAKAERNIDPGLRSIVSETRNNIIYTRITNREGEFIDIIFNNARNDAILLLDGQEIPLRGVVTASGTKYSNNQYTFMQWKDYIELTKDGETIFLY
ncbi:MAG: MliC family protein [Spirochaetaceae bacterium]|nr:MliC family protein [Spirochaetaceae bacterium]